MLRHTHPSRATGPSVIYDTRSIPHETRRATKEQLRALLRTGSLQDTNAVKARLEELVERAAQTETTRLWRTVCRWWKEIEVLIVTGATTAKWKRTTPPSKT
jgi:hypothetical protein